MSDYAPEYTNRERALFVIKQIFWVLLLYAAAQLWFFNWLAEYSDKANCYYYGDVTGVHLVMYGLFLGIPLSIAFIIAIFEGRRSIRIFRLGQNPLPGEKVFKKTKYKYGREAKIQPVVLLLFIGFLLVLAGWGSMQAYKITQNIKPCKQQLTGQSTTQLTVPDSLRYAWALNAHAPHRIDGH